ncbi:MAG: SDR family NAD(P)-dependent oxidoreductase [Pyrinomonadaceae bacterium]|nr:SDR family NAD(P)-dependent oxidoreductase [Pyrinomonadaceae bacterium]MCX7639789.1 SDR family NAD(P)-dependent oxidoreductase [Pyrinomonadaceae bacterium]MDW8304372.1 SDR family NAD(P)-dependent oxidoreductase [Acidobacteriota bacterium]
MSSFWKGKTVFITGASSGIGAEMARQVSAMGATVGLLARRFEELEKLRNEIESLGGKARVFAVDVTNYESCVQAVESFVTEFGKIDILVANAGIAGKVVNAWEIEPKNFEQVIRVNLLGAVNIVRAVLPYMLERNEGQLVAISSLAGFRGLPKSASYCASKSAMNAFFESVRVDLFSSRISVSIIQPGFIRTPLTAGRRSKMPFLMELEPATRKIVKAIEKRKKFYAFPFPLATLVRLARFFPASLYDRMVSKRSYRQ